MVQADKKSAPQKIRYKKARKWDQGSFHFKNASDKKEFSKGARTILHLLSEKLVIKSENKMLYQ